MVIETAVLAGLIVILILRMESMDRRAEREGREWRYAFLSKHATGAAIAKRVAENPDPKLHEQDYHVASTAQRAESAPRVDEPEPAYDEMNADEEGFVGIA